MPKVMFVNKFGNNEVRDMSHIPRNGDLVPIFYQPYPRVTKVAWFPEKILPELEGREIDVLITLE